MKAIRCELCGSNDVKKEGDVFVCQHCGTQYEPEAAKKLMVEVDNSKKINNLRERARKSLEVDDLEHASEYFKEILDEYPDDWEAYFYSYLGEFPSFTNAQAGSVADKLGNTIPPAYDMAIETSDTPQEAAERIDIITKKTTDRLVGIAATAESLLRQYEGGSTWTPEGQVNNNMYNNMRDLASNTIISCIFALNPLDDKLNEIQNNERIDKEALKKSQLYLRKARYNLSDLTFAPTSGTTERLVKAEKIHEYAQKVNELDSSFSVPSVETKTNSSGCYVATAVYGSYDCPQVWVLRRWRDLCLKQTPFGRLFIKFYYFISPSLVNHFGDAKWFKKICRPHLDSLVKKCQQKGFADTPYTDSRN